jgi:hypothetical protein
MEATMFSGWIYDHLKPHAAELKVAHPLMLPWPANVYFIDRRGGRVLAAYRQEMTAGPETSDKMLPRCRIHSYAMITSESTENRRKWSFRMASKTPPNQFSVDRPIHSKSEDLPDSPPDTDHRNHGR